MYQSYIANKGWGQLHQQQQQQRPQIGQHQPHPSSTSQPSHVPASL